MKPTDPPASQRWALYASHLGDYMKRWIFRTPWGTLRVHKIQQSDEGRDFHDHPFDFTSLIFRGGYIEHRPGCWCPVWTGDGPVPPSPCRVFLAPTIVRRKATDFHRLELKPWIGSAWTFVISSRYFRPWGFLLRDGSWVHYQEYQQ